MAEKIRALVAFSTTWGAKFGGINSFNYDFLCALSGVAFDRLEVVCIVLSATPVEVADAAREQIKLITLNLPENRKFSDDLEPTVWESLQRHGVDISGREVIWLGHDRITGNISVRAAKTRGGRAAVIHHMSYGAYEAYAESAELARLKQDEQREIFKAADVVLAVGPLLRDSLSDLLDDDAVTMLVPGLPEIAARKSPKTFKAYLSGRLSDDAKKIKQAHLGIAAFASAIKAADDNPLIPDVLRGDREPCLNLRGVNWEKTGVDSSASPELDLKCFAEGYSLRAFNLIALPFTTQRDVLFTELSGSSVAMMPSWHEGFGLVGWESIGAGVPLIVSKKSGVYRLLGELDFGMHCSLVMTIDVAGSSVAPYFLPKDQENLTQAIIQVAKDQVEWKKKAARLREELAKTYTWAACAKTMLRACSWLDLASDRTSAGAPAETGFSDEPAARTCDLLEKPTSIWSPRSGISDSQLLRAEEAVIPFHPNREPFLLDQVRWAEDNHYPIAVRLLTGRGGVGKTRLAMQLVGRLSQQGWSAGFLRGDCDARQAVDLAKKIAVSVERSLVVVDYAETRQTILLAILRTLLVTATNGHVRVLLLARDGGEWWSLLSSKDSVCEGLLSGMASTGPFTVPQLHSRDEDRQAAYQLALQKIAEKLNIAVPHHRPQLNDEHFAHPLFIQMAALIALRGERPRSAEALTRALVGHERRYWRKAVVGLDANLAVSEDHAALLLALSSLSSGLDTPREIEEVWIACGERKELLKPLFKALTSLYPGRQGLDGWRPDLLGEALIAQVLLTETGERVLAAVTGSNNQRLRRSALTVLGRLLMNRSELGAMVEDALTLNFLRCADDIVSVSIESLGVLPKIAEKAFMRLRGQERSQATGVLARHLQFELLPLTGLDVLVSEALVEKAERANNARKTIASRADLARQLADLSVALKRDGRVGDAWRSACEALELRRAIAKLRPDLYAQDLAASLLHCTSCAYELGRLEEALTAGKEAVQMQEELARHKPAEFEEPLADALAVYAGVLSAQGRENEAFALSEQALKIHEKLFALDQEKFQENYLQSVTNHANRLIEDDQPEAALVLIEKAVDIAKRLATEKPERYEATYATVLSNYAVIAAKTNGTHHTHASDEAMAIWQRLVRAKPARFEPDLAISMSNYAARLSEQGRDLDALIFDEKAIAIRESLAKSEPGRFNGVLAASLSNYAVHLANQGRIEEALIADAKALDLRNALATENPERYEADLAISCSILAEHNAYIGMWGDASAWERKACTLFARAAERVPHLHLSNEFSLIALDIWEWLRTGQKPTRRDPRHDLVKYGSRRTHALLAFKQACLRAFIEGDGSAIDQGVEAWSTFDTALQHYSMDDYITLKILAGVDERSTGDVESLCDQFLKFKQARSGQVPCWMAEIVSRAGQELPS